MAEYISEHKYFLISLLFIFSAVLIVGHFSNSSSPLSSTAYQNVPAPYVQIDTLKIPIELATSTLAIQAGLSGRASLDANRGMLFVFFKPDKYRFWMPDMHFPIDIIWINSGHVVGITKNASNDFNLANPIFYTPPVPAQYVLEVNADFADKNNINIDDGVILNLSNRE